MDCTVVTAVFVYCTVVSAVCVCVSHCCDCTVVIAVSMYYTVVTAPSVYFRAGVGGGETALG